MTSDQTPGSPPEREYRGYAPQGQSSETYNTGEMFQVSYPSGDENAEPAYGAQQQPDNPHQQQNYEQPQYQQYQQYQQPPYGQSQYQQYWQPPNGQGLGDVGPDERAGIGMKVRTAAILSCVFGWVGGLIILLVERESRYVRFNAIQSILFFGGMSILQGIVFSPIPFIGRLLSAVFGIATFVGWIVLLRATSQGKYYKLPIVGDLAERMTNSNVFR